MEKINHTYPLKKQKIKELQDSCEVPAINMNNEAVGDSFEATANKEIDGTPIAQNIHRMIEEMCNDYATLTDGEMKKLMDIRAKELYQQLNK